jgi:hypothetical protein
MFDTYGNKTICEMNGERTFTEFALNTMELQGTQQQHEDQIHLKILLAKV